MKYRPRGARVLAAGLWCVLAVLLFAWVLLLWHPWIDWFGRPHA